MRARAFMVTGSIVLALALTTVSASAESAADVKRAQQALKQAGHDPGPVDGVMGDRTRAALEAYQKAQGLEASGKLDAATAAKLGAPAGTNASASPQTGGDTRPNAVDPAQSSKTGSNAGEGASYSRSTEKGHSTK